MANHKQHITFSTVSGLLFGGLAWYPCGFPAVTCLLSGGLCSVGGMLPDIDIKTSRSFQDCMSITACIAAMVLIIRVNATGISAEMVSIIGAAAFVAIKFGVGGFLRAFTVHRGLIHSIPFGILCGEIMFLVMPGDVSSRILKAAGLTLGFFSHLLLDEIYSVKVTQGKLSTKKSFGTALKLGQLKNMPLTIVLYFLLFGATYLSFQQPTLVGEAFDKALDQLAGLTVRGAQHFEVASQKAQQHLRENTSLPNLRAGVQTAESPDGSALEPEPPPTAVARGDSGRRYTIPDILSAGNTVTSTPPTIPAVTRPEAVTVATYGTTSNLQLPPARPLMLDEIPTRQTQISSQTPLQRPRMLGETGQSTATSQLPPAYPIQ